MKNLPRTLATGLAVLVITACGGGGGGGGGSALVAPPPDDAPITSSNAREIAGEVFESLRDSASFGDFGSAGLIGSSGGGSLTLSKAASHAATKAGVVQAEAAGALIGVAFGPERTDCAVSGSVTVSGDIQNPEMLSAGDTVSLRFDECDEGNGQVVNGNLNMVIDTLTGDPAGGFFALGVTLDFQVFRIVESGETTLVNGGFSMLVDSTDYPVTVASLSSPYLSVTDGSDTVTLSNYSTSVTVDESSQPPAYTLTASGRIDIPSQGGSVNYTTRAPFAGFGDADPDSGALFIRGADGASITLTVLSNTQVQLEMDYDGNGTIDETVIVTWVELDA
jgi:hypothetical protein